MALTSWTEYDESLLTNEPWVEKLKKQTEATLEFVNNPEGLVTTVAKAVKMQEDLERIILLISGKSKMTRVIHSCFVADGKIWGIHGTHFTSPIVDVLGRKACEKKMLSMDSYPPTEGFLNCCKAVEEFSALAGEKRGTKMVLPSLFAVPPDLLVAVLDELEMKADTAAVGVIKAFHDSVSDKVEVPEAIPVNKCATPPFS
jgi:hypothetical protein